MTRLVWAVLAPAVAVAAWRLHAALEAPWSAIVAGAASLVALGISFALDLRRTMAGLPIRLAAVAGLGAATAFTGVGDDLWPCATACTAGARYAAFAGLGAEWWAGAALGMMAIAGTTQAHQTRIAPPLEALGWVCVGATCYYLVLSIALGMLCPHCLAVHSVVLCLLPALLAGGGLGGGSRVGMTAVAALALHAGYHPIAPAPGPAAPAALTADDVRLLSRMDRGRRYGAGDAPLIAELRISLHCPHCRDLVPRLFAALDDALERDRVHLVLRVVYQDSDGLRRLPRLALAAAAEGRLRAFLAVALGAPDGTDETDLPADWRHLAGIADAYPAAIDALLAGDHARMRSLGDPGSVPGLDLLRRGEAEAIARWRGSVDLDALRAAIAGRGRIR